MRNLKKIAVISAAFFSSLVLANSELRLYNWADYIAPEIPKDFAKQNNIKLTWDVFEATEVLEAKLLTGKSGYDLVVPTNPTLQRMGKIGIFAPLDKNKLPNWQHLDPALLEVFAKSDPDNKYGAPYMYGMTIIGFNPAKIKAALGENAPVDSWDLIFKNENLSKLKECGVAFMDSPEDIFPILLHYLGLPPFSTKAEDYEAAVKLMQPLRPNIRYFHSAKYMTDIANGDICVAVGYSGSFYQFAQRSKEAGNGVIIDWRLPKEGAPIWYDSFAIPADAKNIEQAHAFINHLLEPKIIARASNFLGYANPNKGSLPLVAADIRDNPNLVPQGDAIEKLFVLQTVPKEAARIRTRAWNKIKSGL